jgi:uncharacterized protein YyaL (SSP411 family)
MQRIVTNRLAAETSPYLRQHAGNPVHWQPWDEAALTLARETEKPILLSVGYSACHWCHVMAHECFEDPDTAERMNALFVNIKVDREERPDLDQIYQRAHLLIQQRPGGWPLTMFLTPDTQVPFFGGTYFPKVARHGQPAFGDVLERVADFYRTRGAEVTREGNAIVAALERLDATDPVPAAGAPAPRPLDTAPFETARAVMDANFDERHGGFGTAPKFPHAGMLEFLLEGWAESLAGPSPQEDERQRVLALYTLERMGLGGLFDHLGGGFFRYSVDDGWMIPHFEKMLYDNGPLLGLYARAARLAGDERFDHIARETARWLMAQMQSPEGGYFATVDADADGEEGAFYLWSREAVERVLDDAPMRRAFESVYGLDRSPNFEDKWHLQIVVDPEEAAETTGVALETLEHQLAQARARLLRARQTRVEPARDDKILAGWNGLAIRGMAIAAYELGEPAYAASATRAVDFIRTRLWQHGRLYATWREGRSRFPAYLEDHALLGLGLLALLNVRWRAEDLHFAEALADALLERFEDRDRGGFFFTAHDHETLIHRPRPFEDDSTPAGNGAAVRFLTRLGALLGRPEYLEAAERTLHAARPRLEEHPHACASLLMGLRDFLEGPTIVILRGPAEDLAQWQRALRRHEDARRLSGATVLAIPADVPDETLPPALRGKQPTAGKVTAWCCRGTRCDAPVDAVDALVALAGRRAASAG